jgi:hypothetical protein
MCVWTDIARWELPTQFLMPRTDSLQLQSESGDMNRSAVLGERGGTSAVRPVEFPM